MFSEQERERMLANFMAGTPFLPETDRGHLASASVGMYDFVCALNRPSAIMRPSLRLDGNKWCALYGDNIQDGVAGFGDSPFEAMAAFDKAWCAKLCVGVPTDTRPETPAGSEEK